MISSPNILKSADLILLLAISGTRTAERNTRISAKTKRDKTCNICASPRLLLWKLNPLIHSCDCWGTQQMEHPGEPVRVAVFALAVGTAVCPSLKHPMKVVRNLQNLHG